MFNVAYYQKSGNVILVILLLYCDHTLLWRGDTNMRLKCALTLSVT